jgi:hypothetical protein
MARWQPYLNKEKTGWAMQKLRAYFGMFDRVLLRLMMLAATILLIMMGLGNGAFL